MDEACAEQGKGELAGGFEEEAKGLLLKVDGEAGLPVAVDGLGGALGEHPAATGSGFDGADGLEEIDVGGAAGKQGFADGEHVDDVEALLHALGGLALAAGAPGWDVSPAAMP